ncbi:MAG TPA: hypothetical protein VNO25_22585 [Streptosporangiaceae bacterium]|nr:hypothetical protein [Streptosporangiaceae bacterium]
MEPAQVFVALIGWALIVTAGYHVGKYKGRETAGLILTILLGLVGLGILACLPKTEAVKAAEARRQLPYPPEYPDPQYPYPPYQYPPQTQYPSQTQFPPQYPPQTEYPPPGPYPPPAPYPPPPPWDPPPS